MNAIASSDTWLTINVCIVLYGTTYTMVSWTNCMLCNVYELHSHIYDIWHTQRISKLILIDSRQSQKANPEAYIWIFSHQYMKLVDGWSLVGKVHIIFLLLFSENKPPYSMAISTQFSLIMVFENFTEKTQFQLQQTTIAQSDWALMIHCNVNGWQDHCVWTAL